MENKKEEKVFKGHTGWIKAVAISPDDRIIASGSEDKLEYLNNEIFKECWKFEILKQVMKFAVWKGTKAQ